jgi:hypothetical protein
MRAAKEGKFRNGNEAAAFMMDIRMRYKKSEIGIAIGAAKGRNADTRAAPMPHHIIKVTTGPAAIEARIPANCR